MTVTDSKYHRIAVRKNGRTLNSFYRHPVLLIQETVQVVLDLYICYTKCYTKLKKYYIKMLYKIKSVIQNLKKIYK